MISERPLLRKLQAFRELMTKSYSVMDVTRQLITDGAIEQSALHEVEVAYDKIETLFLQLELSYKSGKVMLLDYRWQLLPTQSITLTIVTPLVKKELTYECP